MRSTVFLLVAFAAAPAWADTLLMEFRHVGGNSISAVGQPAKLEFGITGSIRAVLGGSYTTSDIGSTFAAEGETLTIFKTLLEDDPTANAWFDSANVFGPSSQRTVEELWQDLFDPNLTIQRFVEQLGPGFSGYAITDVTQTIDDIRYIEGGGSTTGVLAQQSVRIYGVNVPELASAWLLMIGAAVLRCRNNRVARGRA